MDIMRSEWRDRISHWIRTLREDLYEPLGVIRLEMAATMDYLSPEEAEKLHYTPVKPGFSWGNTWEYGWFRGTIRIPENAEGARIVMNLDPGGESTLFVNGKSFGTYRAAGIPVPYHYMLDNTLTRQAEGGETFSLLMETYAGHFYPDANGNVATGPVLPGSFTDPLKEGKRRTLGICTYGIWNEDAYQLLMDAGTLQLLLDTLDPASLRASKVAKALEQFTLDVDFEQGRQQRIASYRLARRSLKEALDAANGSTAPLYYAVGNAHLDLAWLWPMNETCRKTARTFAAQLRLLEEYPDYKFLQSQPAAYEMCREHYPELFERIREAVRQGRWIAEGAMWVEPDTNMAGGEALIRQLMYGKKYFRDVLETDSVVLWLPDTFGYTAALPQILLGCGVKYLVTQKIFWSYNEGDPFPYHYFSWEGMDGSRITAFLPTSYTYTTDPKELNDEWRKRTQIRDLDSFLIPFGYGDGGGGPTRDHVEFALRGKDLEGAPRIRMAGPVEFFEDMDKKGGPANTYTGELYFNAHRGTFTSQALVKKHNRLAEKALMEMELWSAMASLKGFPDDRKTAERLWKELLLHQFHDILPGSGIARVYRESNRRVSAVIKEADEKCLESLKKLSCPEDPDYLKDRESNGAVTVCSSLSFASTQTITLPDRFAGGCCTADGSHVMTEVTADGVRASVTVPPLGFTILYPKAFPEEKETDTTRRAAEGSPGSHIVSCERGYILENQNLRVLVSFEGEITSLIRKENNREYAAAPMNHFRLFKDVPRNFDAWDIDSVYTMQEIPAVRNVKIQPVREGLEAVLQVTGELSNSCFSQRIILPADREEILFETEVNWDELHKLLKVSFPTTIFTTEAFNEIQFGYVKRPTKRSRDYEKDRFEVCNHRYTALQDGRNGAAVLNDCKYGISAEGGDMELTLLRAAAAPEMCADKGRHIFTYAFTVWDSPITDCVPVKRGYELGHPFRVADGAVTSLNSFASVDRQNVIIETVKTAEDNSGDLILRLYEAAGSAVKANLTICFAGIFQEADMLENPRKDLTSDGHRVPLDFRAFEIKTIRIHKA